MRTIIVGGVAGGATVAARLRRNIEDASITIFERGPDISYANCGLPYYIGGVIPERERLFVQTPAGFEENFKIEARVNHEVVSIDRKNKRIRVRRIKGAGISEPGRVDGPGDAAAEEGASPNLFFSFSGVLLLRRGRPPEGVTRRIQELGLSPLDELLGAASKAGVRLVVCAKSMERMGVPAESLTDGVTIGNASQYLAEFGAREPNVSI